MKIVLITTAVLLIATALFSQGVVKSLAELGAFLTIVGYLYSRQRQPSK
ncbi:hypothetical protein [Vibrio sp. F74]